MAEFGHLNRHLIAQVYPTNRKGVSQGDEIQALITEATMEVALGWQSPFEAMGPEATSPTLLAMVQSGSMAELFGSLGGGWFGDLFGGFSDLIGDWIGGDPGAIPGLLDSAVGRTGLTKMNSTQVFTGMPPLKINATLLFRAWANPRTEVEEPFNSLMSWALPQCLQRDGVLSGILNGGSGACPSSGEGTAAAGLDKLLPSITPKMVGLTYKDRTYKPLVIESVGYPMDSPITSDGEHVELLVPVTFATWQALDARDWKGIRRINL